MSSSALNTSADSDGTNPLSLSASQRSRRSSRRVSVLNPSIQVHKVNLELSIRKLHLSQAPEGAMLNTLLIRGSKTIDTRASKASNGQVSYRAKFSMKSSLEFDKDKQLYVSKPSELEVLLESEGTKGQYVAQAELDLAKYVGGNKVIEKLPLSCKKDYSPIGIAQGDAIEV